jgi:tetratricopeptide (TPR) repeat protein
MTKGQIILLASAVGLVAALYFLMPVISEKHSPAQSGASRDKAAAEPDLSGFDIASYRSEQLSALPAEVQETIAQLNETLETAEGTAKKELLLEQKKLFLENRMPILAAMTLVQIAEHEPEADNWNSAGHLFMAIAVNEQDDASLADYAMQQAIECYGKALDLKPENVDYKINLASALMESGKETMQGVQMLLELLQQHPDNIPANLMLGRFGIVSGQYEKAMTRLEKVVKLDPTNTEAYFYLAEAYHGLGRKDDAIKAFEICKKLVNDPGFSAEIDRYIQKIKNS